MSVEFTMKRAGDAKGDEAWTTLLKRIQTVLGEKYDVLRLIVSEDPLELRGPGDKVFEAGWPRGYWESWYEYSGQRAEDQAKAEEEALMETPAQAPTEEELAAQVEAEETEAYLEDRALEEAEAAEHAPDEPDPAA